MIQWIALCVLASLCTVDATTGWTVNGNQVLYNGQTTILRGANLVLDLTVNGAVNGHVLTLSDYQLLYGWSQFNVVRLSLSQDLWLATSTAAAYKATIAQHIAWIKSAGFSGVILVLSYTDGGILSNPNGGGKWSLPDANSVTFWVQVATAYANDPTIIFELFNNPNGVTWSQWLNGGSISCNGITYSAAGMQQVYNGIRLTARASNPVIIGGIAAAYDLSGVTSNLIAGATGILWATHPYDGSSQQPSTWDQAFGNTFPTIITEFGQYCNNDGYVARLLAYAEYRGIHWIATAWTNAASGGCQANALISDWQGTPTALGAVIKAELAFIHSTDTVIPIFTDALQSPWVDYGWASDLLWTDNYAHSGLYGLSCTLGPGGIYLHSTTPFSITYVSAIKFYINGGASSGQAIQIRLYDASTPVPVSYSKTVVLPNPVLVNTWVLQSISLALFNLPAGASFTGIVIEAVAGALQSKIWIDDLVLVLLSGATAPPSPPATVAPTTAPGITAGSIAAVYSDSVLSPWVSFGFASDLTFTATPAHSGSYSVGFTPSGVYFHSTISFSIDLFVSIQFWINGVSSSGQALVVRFYDNTSPTPLIIGKAVSLTTAVQANTWSLEVISLAAFNIAAGTFISGFQILSAAGNQQKVCIDDILLNLASPPTAPPTTTSTKAPATTTTTTAPNSACSISNIVFTQTAAASLLADLGLAYRFAISIEHSCQGFVLTGVTFQVSNWNPVLPLSATLVNLVVVSNNLIALGSGVSISYQKPYTSCSYENYGTPTFVIQSAQWKSASTTNTRSIPSSDLASGTDYNPDVMWHSADELMETITAEK